MFVVFRDLVRYNREFLVGFVLVAFIVFFSCLSFVSPVNPELQYVVPLDLPPSSEYWFGTNSSGQDLFWQATFAIRNTLTFGIVVAFLSRIISIAVGLVAGYVGGWFDRALMTVNDIVVALPIFPILVLIYYVLRDDLTAIKLAVVMACFGWPFDARLIRSATLSLRHREFTRHAVFAGMSARKIMFGEHLPYVMPIVFSTAMANMIWSIGLSVTLAVLGFTDINVPTIGTMLYWANNHSAIVVGTWWWIAVPVVLIVITFIGLYLLAVSVNEYIDPRFALAADGQLMTATDDVLTVKGLKAYYLTKYFGVDREVRAVDDVTLSVRKNEIYGLAGESSSGKTTLIKTFAAAIRPPLRIVDGSMTYHFKNGDIDPYAAARSKVEALRWKHLSYVMQGSMSLLNPVRRIRKTFEDFAFRPMGLPSTEFWGAVESHLRRLELSPDVLNAYPHQLSGGMRQRVAIALATVCQPEFVIADEPTTALDVVVQKDVLAMIRDVQRLMGSSVVFVTHDMSVHANSADRIGIMYAGRLVEEGPTRTLFTAPKHPYTAHLVASLPRIGDTTPKAMLDGRPPNLAEPPTGCRFHPRCPLAIDRCMTDVPPLELVGPDHRSACWRSAEVRPLARIGSEALEVAR